MVGAAKQRANRERVQHHGDDGSSSGKSSSSGKATQSARSAHSASRSHRSRGGYDGNRDPGSPGAERNPATARTAVDNPKNLDLGTAGWSVARGVNLPTNLAARPPLSKLGVAQKMGLNSFLVDKLPSNRVFQFDVIVGNGAEKPGLIKKVWHSKGVSQELGKGFIFDGNKLAWSMKPIEREVRITVDLDKEEGRTPKEGKENIHRVMIRQTNSVRIDTLAEYLDGKVSFNNAVLETINFFDHLLREYPSQQYTPIKRNFFARGQERFTLGNGIEAMKGVYASMRIVNRAPKAQLAINVDVANGTFWTAQPLLNAAVALTGKRDPNDLGSALRQGGEKSRTGQDLRKLRKLHVIAGHRGGAQDAYVIERFVYTSARDMKFEKDGKSISIYDYFMRQFNVRLQYPDLPLCKMTKGKNTYLPMEVLKLKENQRYMFKLDEKQTSNMIKFAVEPPPQRWKAIQHGLNMLAWDKDPVLNAFGLKINPTMTVVDARLLTAPKVQFGKGEAKPGTSGRWDLKGKSFFKANTAPLKSWGVCVVPGRRGGKPDRAVVENFINEFCKIYTMHGGRIENKKPAMTLASTDDVGSWVTNLWNTAGGQSNARPQLLVFILPDKDATTYGRIKRSAECRYGVVSQCMQYAHVQKGQAQYISNVCMKVNAKLGGTTARAVGPKSTGPGGQFSASTVVIGADVSHAAPGSDTPSMAAMTVSMDKLGVRYAAACETNGYRVEMIQTDTLNACIKPLLQSWVRDVNDQKFPNRVIYMRDGVSEGQYQHVLQQEVFDLKTLLKTAKPDLDIPFIVLVCGKRHHVRFFPDTGKGGGDRNGNAHPGTLVETGVTHPFENDFYLQSHAAIKGTARPAHYHVLLNEAGISNEELQTLIYEQCYGYIRATTPISQHPAIYYAHIASNRAIPHDPKWSGSSDGTPSSRPRSGSGSGSQTGGSGGKSGGSSSNATPEFEKLLPMPNQAGIQTSMWYI